MNFLDIIVIIPILWGAFKGFKNGLISEAGTMISLVLGIWAAVTFSDVFSQYIAEFTSIDERYHQVAAFGVIFIAIIFLCFIITRILIRFCKAIKILWLDKLLGVILGISKYLVVLSFLFYLANTLIRSYATKPIEVVETSVFFKPLANTAESFISGKISVPQIEKPSIFTPSKSEENEDK